MNTNHTRRSVARWPLALLIAVVLGARDAQAYLDPTTGSMVLQGIVGGIMAGLFIVRTRWTQLKGWFDRRRAPREETPSAPSDGDAD